MVKLPKQFRYHLLPILETFPQIKQQIHSK